MQGWGYRKKEWDQSNNSAGQTSNPVEYVQHLWHHDVMVWLPTSVGRSIPLALSVAAPDLFLGLALVDPCSSPQQTLHGSWGLNCIFGFTLPASPIAPSGAACRNPNIATHCLASQAFLWNLGWILCDPIALAFCILAKTTSHGPWTMLAWTVARLSWILDTIASDCQDGWM
jgi:hypothetical protein